MAEVSQSWTYNGEWRKFKVPHNVKILKVELTGGGSGTTQGGRVHAKLRVKDTDEVYFFLGQKGRSGSGLHGGGVAKGGGGPGGDAGHNTRLGADGGGGATELHLNAAGGRLVAVAGGAGGDTNENGGTGGDGGGKTGESGNRGDGSGNKATGGSQAKGGNGGTVGNANFNGDNAPDAILARGGKGGTAGNDKANGGGGGGGGYHAGGGGQAGKVGSWPAGGGGGGSSFVEELFDVTTNDRAGGTDHGTLTIYWQEDGDYPPSPPTVVKINGVEETDEMILHSYSAEITGKPDDPTKNQDVRMVLYLADSKQDLAFVDDPYVVFRAAIPYATYHGTWDDGAKVDRIKISGLTPNKLYYGRLYSQDRRGQQSSSYVGLSFWTNRPPNPPTLDSPDDFTDFESTDDIEFAWTPDDPDTESGHPETTSKWKFRWRRSATPTDAATPWTEASFTNSDTSVTIAASAFPAGGYYEWQVATRDPLGLWGDWSILQHFQITAAAVAPNPLYPAAGVAVIYTETIRFTWKFKTITADETQETVDLRYRVYGSDDDWEIIDGDLIDPGAHEYLDLDPETFNPFVHYEWQIRSHTSNDTESPWSISRDFWTASLPGIVVDDVPLDFSRPQGALGVGVNKAYAYTRGGKNFLGEIGPFSKITWGRKRDAISSCTINISAWTPEQKEFYKSLKSWAVEVVVFRDGVRCWEGPIVRRGSSNGALEIEAQDPMVYVYRRLMRQGYTDAYQLNAGVQVGLHSVVWRARQIMLNALIYDDPNVLPYLTTMMYPTDARQSKVVKAYSKTAWQEIDDMAANSGIDYTTIGRRIVLNDTHRPVGRLPEMGDDDFSDPPVVTEYGMSYATDFAATNNNGIYGLATRRSGNDFDETGFVEMLASEYGESDAASGADSLTPAQIAALEETLTQQAERNIGARYPMPLVVRVPDNSTLNPEINLGINQIVPGVWIPLRSTTGIIEASQWQKLDSMTVTQDSSGEKISVVMSPAPNEGQDPDAQISLEDA